jgi:hypothetical protein
MVTVTVTVTVTSLAAVSGPWDAGAGQTTIYAVAGVKDAHEGQLNGSARSLYGTVAVCLFAPWESKRGLQTSCATWDGVERWKLLKRQLISSAEGAV